MSVSERLWLGAVPLSSTHPTYLLPQAPSVRHEEFLGRLHFPPQRRTHLRAHAQDHQAGHLSVSGEGLVRWVGCEEKKQPLAKKHLEPPGLLWIKCRLL